MTRSQRFLVVQQQQQQQQQGLEQRQRQRHRGKRRKIAIGAICVTIALYGLSNGVLNSSRRRGLSAVSASTPSIESDGTLLIHRRTRVQPCHFVVPSHDLNRSESSSSPIKRLHYHFDDCNEAQLGNRLGEHYLRYLTANAMQVPYQMSCGTAHDETSHDKKKRHKKVQRNNSTKINSPFYTKDDGMRRESVLRHLTLNLTEPGPYPVDPFTGEVWNIHHVCNTCVSTGWSCSKAMNLMFPIMKQDMMRLAYRSEAGQWLQRNEEDDDAVIHLRLGDALRGPNDQGLGLLPHDLYSRLLFQAQAAKETTIGSIGIVTQPFERRQGGRAFDANDETLHKSRLVAEDLVRHLRHHFPEATVRIHNGRGETPLKAMARLVRARTVAVCGASTFCTIPVLSVDRGMGFLFRAYKHSPWAHSVVKQYKGSSKLQSFEAPRLTNNFIERLQMDTILYWLRNQASNVGLHRISDHPLIRTQLYNETV